MEILTLIPAWAVVAITIVALVAALCGIVWAIQDLWHSLERERKGK